MRFLFVIVFVLLLAGQSDAETYSWVDETGTCNFSEDLSRVPKRYHKSVKRYGDIGSQTASPVKITSEKNKQDDSCPVDVSCGKPTGLPGEDTQLYGGKTRDAWRRELNANESELSRLEQQLEQMQNQIKKPSGLSLARQAELIKE